MLIFFFKLFAALLFLCLFKILFKLFALGSALVWKVSLSRYSTDGALELDGLPF